MLGSKAHKKLYCPLKFILVDNIFISSSFFHFHSCIFPWWVLKKSFFHPYLTFPLRFSSFIKMSAKWCHFLVCNARRWIVKCTQCGLSMTIKLFFSFTSFTGNLLTQFPLTPSFFAYILSLFVLDMHDVMMDSLVRGAFARGDKFSYKSDWFYVRIYWHFYLMMRVEIFFSLCDNLQ